MDINSVAFLFLLRSYSLNWGRWAEGGGGGGGGRSYQDRVSG